MSREVLVIGAGIGGLCAAIALRRSGREVRVLERAPRLEAVGAGLMVATNAVRVLFELGVGERLAEVSPPARTAVIEASDGRVLRSVPIGELAARYGAETFCMHRADLHRILLEALPPDCVETGAELVDFEQTPEGVSAELEGGRTLSGSLLIGADGLRSRVRARLLGDHAPRYAGYGCWRGIAIRADSLIPPGELVERWGRGIRLGTVNVGAGRVYWFAVANRPESHAPAAGRVAELCELFASFPDPAPALLDATPDDAIVYNAICDRDPTRRWGEGRATLLGDAAHPMEPNLGQGACQAIEDAGVLARHVASADVDGLRAYERERQPRTAWIQQRSRQLGVVSQLEGSWSTRLRNAAVRATPGLVMERQYQRLFAAGG